MIKQYIFRANGLILQIEEDSEGNIWPGTEIQELDMTARLYKPLSMLTPMICPYKDNIIICFFGMAEGGVYKFNGKSLIKRFDKK
jgi:hypothetical protein